MCTNLLQVGSLTGRTARCDEKDFCVLLEVVDTLFSIRGKWDDRPILRDHREYEMVCRQVSAKPGGAGKEDTHLAMASSG
jgi:hypothetical protein